MALYLIENKHLVPLIDEEFDAFALDLTPGHEWTELACDETWDADYSAVPVRSAL